MLPTVNFHENLVQVPTPAGRFHAFDPALSDRGREGRTELQPPVPNCLMANVDAPPMKQIFNIPQGQWKPDIADHRKADDLWAGFEEAKWGTLGHTTRLRDRPAPLKALSSDSTATTPETKSIRNSTASCVMRHSFSCPVANFDTYDLWPVFAFLYAPQTQNLNAANNAP